MFIDLDRIAYNKLTGFSDLCTNILNFLMAENENLWKLLFYDTPDALEKPNLTMEQKRSLIYGGVGDSEDYRVFRCPYMDDAVTKELTQMRHYVMTVTPENRSVSVIDFAFDCITHVKLSNLEGCQSRVERMVEEILSTVNGRDIDGVGRIFFDTRRAGYDGARNSIFNNRYFYGFQLIMSVNYGDLEGYIDDE